MIQNQLNIPKTRWIITNWCIVDNASSNKITWKTWNNIYCLQMIKFYKLSITNVFHLEKVLGSPEDLVSMVLNLFRMGFRCKFE